MSVDVDILRQLHHEQRTPDPAHIAKLPKPTKRDNAKGRCDECGGWHGLPAVHLDYMGHAEVTDVLLEADPTWTWEPYATDDRGLPLVTDMGADRVLWIRLTIGGVTRPGVGTAASSKGGDALKELIGDAIRNAAMRFGIALTLWSKAEGVERDTPAPDAADPEDVAEIKARVNALGKEGRRRFLDRFGHPDGLTATLLPAAVGFVTELEHEATQIALDAIDQEAEMAKAGDR